MLARRFDEPNRRRSAGSHDRIAKGEKYRCDGALAIRSVHRRTRSPDHGDVMTDQQPLYTKPEPTVADADDDSPLGLFGTGLIFLALTVAVNIWWDDLSLPEDSFAGGRNAARRRLVSRIGQMPLTIGLVAIGLVALAFAVNAVVKQRRRSA
jgi:hypothetical protein